MNELKFTSIAI